MSWRCGSCGGDNAEGMRFCGHCGTPAGVSTAPAPQPADPGSDTLRAFVTGQVADRLVEAGGQLTEERRLVTALFADLSGFTPLSERLDAEELLEVIDPIIRSLSDIIGRYEGFVEKFAGDALLALFGAPVAHEDDALRAVIVAGEMHRELARLRADFGPDAADLTLHIGINTGHGVARMIGSQVRMDYAVLGESVILAQRLESAAPPGETYIGESTWRLVKDRFDLEPVGPLTLKGKAEPVPAWRVAGTVKASNATGEPLVGRDTDLEALLAALRRPAAVVAVLGEPGVGKSRLIAEARTAAEAGGASWLVARCVSYGATLAYWPFADLLRRWAGIPPDASPADARARLDASLDQPGVTDAAPLARVAGLPLGAAEAAELDAMAPEGLKRRIHDAMASWLGAESARGVATLLVEDVHWADASSIELLGALAADPTRLAILVTGRPDAVSVVERLPISERLDLGPLDDNAVDALVRAILGGAPPRGLTAAVADRSGGNPLFAEEVVRSLLDARILRQEHGRWQLPPTWSAAEVPATVEGVLAARLDALPNPAVRTVEAAAVIGRRVPVALLRRVAEPAPGAVEALVAAGMLAQPPAGSGDILVFHHALTQEVAYGRLLRRRRRALHEKTGTAARDLYGEGDDVVDLLARHFYLGEAGAAAIGYLLRAGERARRLYANETAIVHFERAAELCAAAEPADPRLAAALLSVADIRELVGDYAGAHDAYVRARDARAGVDAWRGIASTLRRQGRYADALAVLDEALRGVDPSVIDDRPLWLERGWTLSMAGELEEAATALHTGITRGQGDDVTAARLRIELARTESTMGRFTAALKEAQTAVAVFQQQGDRRALATALRVTGGIHHDLSQLDDAAALLHEALSAAEQVGSVEEIGGSLINLGLVERDRGRLDEAIEADRRAIAEFERIGHGSGRAIGYANLAGKLVQRGDLEGASRYCDLAVELASAIGHAMTVADSTLLSAEIRFEQARYAEAATTAERAAELFREQGAIPAVIESLGVAQKALAAAGQHERASALEAEATALAATTG